MDAAWLEKIDSALQQNDPVQEVDLLHAIHDSFLEEEIRRGSLADISVLDGFMHYALSRRFGWSESVPGASRPADIGRPDSPVEDLEGRCPTPSPTQHARPQQERENLKHAINKSLDHYLTVVQKSTDVQREMSTVLMRLIAPNRVELPFVRGQLYKYFFDWLKYQLGGGDGIWDGSGGDNSWLDDCFGDIQRVLVGGLTDVWSAIRKSCANRLSTVADAFVMDQMKALTDELLALCASADSSWQQVEGSLLGLSAIVKRFRVELLPAPAEQSVSLRPEELPAVFQIHFGSQTYQQLPDFISDKLHAVLFERLAHQQLSVRESANKVFAAVLARSDVSTAIATLDEAVQRLSGQHANSSPRGSSSVRVLAAADEAAGLLTLCITILKQLPASSLCRLPEMTQTFHDYLAHPASTVRQVTSTLFECLATRDSSSSSDMLTTVLTTLTTSPGEAEPPLKWQAREGRLLAVELIVRRLVRGHLARLLNLELRLELKSPEMASDGSIDASPLPLWPKTNGRLKGGPKTAAEDMSLIDRLRWCRGSGTVDAVSALGPELWTRLIEHTVDCMTSSQWELRRMADQVMPLLTQVVFWFDMQILESLWNSALSSEQLNSLADDAQLPSLTLAACVTLKYSLCLSARLTQLLLTASAARLLVTDRAEQVQALLARFNQVAAPLTPSVALVLRRVPQTQVSVKTQLLEVCVEVLLYAHSYGVQENPADCIEMVQCLEQIQASAAKHADREVGQPVVAGAEKNGAAAESPPPGTMPARQAANVQSSIVSSMYAVLPELALRIAPEHLLQCARLQLRWALQYDHTEERKCILEGCRRVLLRVVRLRNIATEWPWDGTPGESLAQRANSYSPCSSPVAAMPPSEPAPPETPADRVYSLSIDVGGSTGKVGGANIRQAILASIDSLINVGMPPKLPHNRRTLWPSRSTDQVWLGTEGVDPKPIAASVVRALIPLVEQKGLEMSILRLVMEVLCAACILLRELECCLPRIADSMVLRLRREGVTSRVEREHLEECRGLGMHSNDTKADTAESSEEDTQGFDGDQTTSDWDDDSFDDEAGVFSIDSLVNEFGKFLMCLSVHFPSVNTKEVSGFGMASALTPGKRPTSSVIEYLATSTTSPCCWPGLTDETARILNWVLVTACQQ